jgi:hypothetical protein
MEKWKFLTLPGLELRPLGRAARSQSLHRLRYPMDHIESLLISWFSNFIWLVEGKSEKVNIVIIKVLKSRFEVLSVVAVNSGIFWDVVSCSLLSLQMFRTDVLPSSSVSKWISSKKQAECKSSVNFYHTKRCHMPGGIVHYQTFVIIYTD